MYVCIKKIKTIYHLKCIGDYEYQTEALQVGHFHRNIACWIFVAFFIIDKNKIQITANYTSPLHIGKDIHIFFNKQIQSTEHYSIHHLTWYTWPDLTLTLYVAGLKACETKIIY